MPKGQHLRKPFTDDHRRNLSLAQMGNKNSLGVVPWNKGFKWSGISNEKNPNWKGGVSSKYRIKKETEAGRARPNKCDSCGGSRGRICFDHCHKTGEFRGWLCDGCNLALGLLGDDIIRVTKLVNYLMNVHKHDSNSEDIPVEEANQGS